MPEAGSSDALWQWDALVEAAEGKADGTPSARITGFSIDTRTIQSGEVFVALRDQRDGHEFVTAAFKAGAAAALVSESYARKPDDGALLFVDEPLKGLERIGVAARDRLAPTAKVIAITGSAGKTGTTQMLSACLRAAASSPSKVHAPEKSFNNHWGVPLTLARMPADTEFGVFEIGMNHAGEIRPLVKLVRPHVAIVTNVLPVHVGNFADGEEGVAKAKAEIFEGLPGGGGVAILPHDSKHFAVLEEGAGRTTKITFGERRPANIRPEEIAEFDDRTEVTLAGGNGHYIVGAPGRHLAVNSMAVASVFWWFWTHKTDQFQQATTCGDYIARSLAPLVHFRAAAGRGARTELRTPGGPVLLIDEGYNANPASVAAALAAMATVARRSFPRRVAVLGDMLELGPEARGYHEGLAPAITASGANLVFACGPNMKFLFDALPPELRGVWAPDSSGLIEAVASALRPGDVVMVKGSLGSRMAPIVDAIKRRFAAAGG